MELELGGLLTAGWTIFNISPPLSQSVRQGRARAGPSKIQQLAGFFNPVRKPTNYSQTIVILISSNSYEIDFL